MVRPILPRINGEYLCTSMPLAIGLFLSILALVALCAKHAKKPSKTSMSTHEKIKTNVCKIAPRLSPLGLPNKNNNKRVDEESGNPTGDVTGEVAGEEGLWQKAIIMGEKCQPPQFSGVLFYDPSGNRVSELPRSPRASNMSRYAC
ncbi:uncharacterized protein LOC132642809 [Lycium barbarum]|uniref:uncharacterized protein LOC132642809 n=1 Tax=Lycium barbarum TaxID=112863 RepID=UPI00293E37C2|nr:uncharacterized protein LOC132642809 [Lycium barbarum]